MRPELQLVLRDPCCSWHGTGQNSIVRCTRKTRAGLLHGPIRPSRQITLDLSVLDRFIFLCQYLLKFPGNETEDESAGGPELEK